MQQCQGGAREYWNAGPRVLLGCDGLEQSYAGSGADALRGCWLHTTRQSNLKCHLSHCHSARQHVPLAAYESNLDTMVTKMKAAHIPRVVLITPPPVYEAGRIKHQQEVVDDGDISVGGRGINPGAAYWGACGRC